MSLNASSSEVNLGTIDVTPVTYSSITKTFGAEYSTYLAYTYEAFTYTNIGGVVDVGVQYHNGAISGWNAAGQFGMAIAFGGAGAKAVKYGFSSFKEARGLYKEWGTGSFSTVGENIRYHADYRGSGNYVKYMRQASNFNKRGASSTGLRSDGSILYKRNGEFLIQRDGLTVTYGRGR